MESQFSPPGSLTQNFFIVLPNNGTATDVSAGAQAETVMRAIQSALVAAPAPQVQSTGMRVTLEDVAREWYQNKVGGWAPSYAGRLRNRLETGLLAHLGPRHIAGISPQDVLEAIRKTEERDVRETARRILRIASAVFRYGVATGQCAQDPTAALKGALKSPRAVKHRATLSARDLPKFLRTLDQYQGDLTRFAMWLVLLTFVRTAELRFAKWSEFEDLGAKTQFGASPVNV